MILWRVGMFVSCILIEMNKQVTATKWMLETLTQSTVNIRKSNIYTQHQYDYHLN